MAVVDLFPTISAFASEHCLLLGLASVVLYFVLNRETRNVPPGPTGLPIVGYIPFLSSDASHKELADLSRKYGPVFSIKLGPNNCIIINDYKSAIEIMNHESIQNRPSPNLISLFVGTEDNLLCWKGNLWKEHRRFILRALRTVGVGKPEIETVIVNEISYMLDQIDKDKDAATGVLVKKYFASSTSNVVNAVITGKRFDYDHPVRVKQDSAFGDGGDPPKTAFTGYINHYVKYLAPFRKLPLELNRIIAEVQEGFSSYIAQEVEEQKKTYKEDGEANIIAAYLSEYDVRKAKDENTLLDRMATNLLGAGSATVKDALEWACLFCALYPDIQAKLIKEIEDMIGYDRKPCYADRTNMPYTQAFLWETMRHSSAIPINLPHVASSDVQYGGYTIPSGYHVYVNFWAIHHDSKYWKEPEKFDVDRFLTPEGNKLVKHEAFMPFSTGRRSCPGEPLAQVELFVYLVMTLQKYRIKPPEGVELTLKSGLEGFSHVPTDLKVLLASRN